MKNAVAVALVAVLLPAAPSSARAIQQFVDVRQVATDTLRDVAVTVIAAGRPTIYYNPRLMQQVGPAMAAFAMAHEYGHVRYGHTGGALSAGGLEAALHLLQELEADCYAARILEATNPDAVKGAVQFFTAMGPFRFGRFHPAGSQRAAKILSCLPGTEPAGPQSLKASGR